MNNLKNNNTNKNLGFTAVNAGNAFTLSVVFLLVFSILLSVVTLSLKIEGDVAYFLNYIPAPVAVIATLLTFYLRGQKNCFKLLKPSKIEPYSAIATALIIIGLMLGLSKINEYFISFLQSLGYNNNTPEFPLYTPNNLVLALFLVCTIPTITEEILMRKIVVDGLSEVGEVFAVFIGGLLFSIFHMSPAQTIYQFIVGSAFCYIVLKGGNYILTMLAHLFNNSFIVLNYYFFNIQVKGIVEVLAVILGLICFFTGVILLYKKGKKLERKVDKNKAVEFLIGSIIGVLICISMWISVLVA